MKKKLELSIIVPIYNEEKYILNLLNSINNQCDKNDNPISKQDFQIVFVDNNCTDSTVRIIKKYQEKSALQCSIITEKKKGIIPARITGFNYTIQNENYTSNYLASVDADVVLHPFWIDSIVNGFKNLNVHAISFSGGFGPEFWCYLPNLVKLHMQEVGPLFFDEETKTRMKLNSKEGLFTEQVFLDFVRPVTSACAAYRTSSYVMAGGYTQEFIDPEKKYELFAEAWRLVFKMEYIGMNQIYIPNTPYITSARRILKQPENFLGLTSTYSNQNPRVQLEKNDYKLLDELSKNVPDFGINKTKYIVRFYILMRCITKPEKIDQNPKYFKTFSENLKQDIIEWRSENPDPCGNDFFVFSELLLNKYYDKILRALKC